MPNFEKKIGPSIAIFRFFSRWRPSAILDLFGAYLDHRREYSLISVTVHCAKFGYDQCSSFDIYERCNFGAS